MITQVKTIKLLDFAEKFKHHEEPFVHLTEKITVPNTAYILDADHQPLYSSVIAEILANHNNVVLINVERKTKMVLDILGASSMVQVCESLEEALAHVNGKYKKIQIDPIKYALYINYY